MADQPTDRDTDSAEDQPNGKFAKLRSCLNWKNLLHVRTIAALLLLSVLINMAAFFSGGADVKKEALKSEITLGEFFFVPNPTEETVVERADFKLHISLLSEVEPLTRARLETHQFRVQQNVEQLLRQAHGGDFRDPSLAELKRQLQERINDSIAVRGIADVIITELKLRTRAAQPATVQVNTAMQSNPASVELNIPPAPTEG